MLRCISTSRRTHVDRQFPQQRQYVSSPSNRGSQLFHQANSKRYERFQAEVAELADAHGSGPCTRKGVGVRVPSSAPAIVLDFAMAKEIICLGNYK